MSGQDKQPGGIPVQPVDDPVSKSLPLFTEIPGDSIGQGIVKVTLGRVDGHASIFIDYQYILVLIHNGKRKLYRHDIPGILLLRQGYLHCLPGLKPVTCVCRNSVHCKSLRGLNAHCQPVGKSLCL